jgi:hypothetical protein
MITGEKQICKKKKKKKTHDVQFPTNQILKNKIEKKINYTK